MLDLNARHIYYLLIQHIILFIIYLYIFVMHSKYYTSQNIYKTETYCRILFEHFVDPTRLYSECT